MVMPIDNTFDPNSWIEEEDTKPSVNFDPNSWKEEEDNLSNIPVGAGGSSFTDARAADTAISSPDPLKIGAGIIRGANKTMTKVNIALDEVFDTLGILPTVMHAGDRARGLLGLPKGERDLEKLKRIRKGRQKYTYKQFSAGKDSWEGSLGEAIGETIPYLLTPSKGLGKTVASGAGIGYVESEGNRLKGAGIGAATGGGAYLGAKAAIGAGKMAYSGIRPKKAMEKSLGRALETEDVPEMLKASKIAQRQKIILTPGEAASRSRVPSAIGALEEANVPTQKALKKIKDVGRKNEARALEIYEEVAGHKTWQEAKAVATKAYEAVKPEKLPTQTNLKLKKDANIQGVIAEIDSKLTKAEKLTAEHLSYKKDTFGYYHALRTRIRKIAKGHRKNSNITAAEMYEAADKKIRNFLMAGSDDYTAATLRWKQASAGESLLKKFEKASGESSVDQIYSTFLRNKASEKEFFDLAQRAGGKLQQAQDLAFLVKKLKKSPAMKFAAKSPGQAGLLKEALDRPDLTGYRWLTSKANLFLQGGQTNAYVKLATDPKWADRIREIRKIKSVYSQLDALGEIISKISAKKATEEE